MTKQINTQELEPFHIRSLMKMGASKIQLIESTATLHLKQLIYRLERIKDRPDYFDNYILEFNSWLERDNWWEVRNNIIQQTVKNISRPPLPDAIDLLNDIQKDVESKYLLEQINLIKECLYVLPSDNNSEKELSDTLELIMLKTPLTIDHVSIINSTNSKKTRNDDLNKFIKKLLDKKPDISSNEVVTKIEAESQIRDSFIETITEEHIEWTNKKESANEKPKSTPISAISNRLSRLKNK
ncbi:hypothetical protein [Thalassotalea sp. PLHSN55]|uniref:hypothetical protein n=1 Tax=Thalassotalea sp. PLHSN55 TaxID=3435888 RepID=UPI003F8746FE